MNTIIDNLRLRPTDIENDHTIGIHNDGYGIGTHFTGGPSDLFIVWDVITTQSNTSITSPHSSYMSSRANNLVRVILEKKNGQKINTANR